jgi:muramoyltetrapeptide carboxypeptidase
MRIAVVAPSCSLDPAIPARIAALSAGRADAPEIIFHQQCFLSEGHFAGSDATRIEALIEVANDPDYDAVWFARGGYGACRVAEPAIKAMDVVARRKLYLGYSDAGFLLAGLYACGIGRVAHGPMPSDMNREGGDAAIHRALDWFANPDAAIAGDEGGTMINLSPPLTSPRRRQVAFNLTVLSQLLGSKLQPDLTDHILLIEDVGEYLYRTDRSLFHITSNPAIRALAGIKIGRFSDIPDNDPDFGMSAEDIVRHWCGVVGIAFLGSANIGHDAQNMVVGFG